ncbi:EF-P lysine aminoacylase GenX [bacterium]|nr:EF-P lysine aminoacylase GenX [bacterium]
MPRDLNKIAKEREIVHNTIRSFFRDRGSVEVDTPIVVRSPGMEPNLMPFETTVVEPDGTRHVAGLITSPEYSMKKLLGLGMRKIFTITKVFRNDEELGGTHNPEFTMLEWYEQGNDYAACMIETEALVRATCAAFGRELPAFRRVRVRDAFLAHVGLDLDGATADDMRASCAKHGIHVDASDTESDLYYRLFLALVEPKLLTGDTTPFFLYDYPVHQAALSRLTPDGKYGERFELYVDGLELCNAFTELVDGEEQRRRFLIEADERRALGKTVFPLDEELLRLLPNVQNPTFGNALGVDRLHMVATNAKSIEDVQLFPAGKLFV